MAQRIVRNQPPAVRGQKSAHDNPSRLPKALLMLAGAAAVGVFSFTQVARISPKRHDVSSIVNEIKKDKPATASALSNRPDPTRGTKLWAKKG